MPHFLSFVIVAGCISPLVFAAGSQSATNSIVISSELISRLFAEARTNSPAVKAAGSRARAAELNTASTRVWEDPVAMLGGSVYGDRGFNPGEEGNLAYGIEQKLPLWGRPALTRRVAETETLMREAEVGYRLKQVRADLIKALVSVAFAERVVEIGEQDSGWLGATAKAIDIKYRTGQASIADTLQIQNEAAKRNENLRTERSTLAHARFTLNRILNRKLNSPWPSLKLPAVAPAIPLSEKLLTLAQRNEPKLNVLKQEIKIAEAAAELTRNKRLPDVSVGVEGRQYSGDGAFRSGMFTVRFSLPWANRERYRKDYEREKEKVAAAEEERDEQLLSVREELHHLVVGIDATRREALLQDHEILIRASQALASRLSEWESGHGAFRDLLDARRMLLESQLMSARAVSEQYQMLAEMFLWSGLEDLDALMVLAAEPSILGEHESH